MLSPGVDVFLGSSELSFGVGFYFSEQEAPLDFHYVEGITILNKFQGVMNLECCLREIVCGRSAQQRGLLQCSACAPELTLVIENKPEAVDPGGMRKGRGERQKIVNR